MTHNNKNDTRRTETDYAPIYLGAEPIITDDDMFRIRLNISESKRAELTISATDRTTDRTTESTTESSEKKFGEKYGKKFGENLGEDSDIDTSQL